MATFYPGAVQRIISRNHGGRRARTNVVVWHVAVSEAASLFGFFNSPSAGASSHFYIRRDGTVEQYVDADLIAWTQRAGNSRGIGIETQGGGSGAWTPEQQAALVSLTRWLCERYGIPKVAATDSRPGTAGIALHRFGCDPWRVSGGEVWGPRGKVCPGNDKAAQYPGLVARVAGNTGPIPGTSPAPAPAPAPAPSGPIKDQRVANMQAALRAGADGYWGPVTTKHGAALRSASGWGGGVFPYGVAFTQSVVGATPDGVWGPKSRKAHDATTAAVQRAIGTAPDGIWGPQSEAAYQALRTAVRGDR